MSTNIIIKTSFEGIHSWPQCPYKDVSFLTYPHRHIFHVVLKIPVTHNDRDIEIIQTKKAVDSYIEDIFGMNLGRKSCEDLAQELLEVFEACYVSVLEDNENGAEVVK